MSTTAVVILNWNGKKHLQRFLPSLIRFTPNARIVIADGNSSDGSCEWLQEQHPNIERIQLGKNYGFAGGYNRALANIPEDNLVLLNSDAEVEAGWLAPLIAHLNADERHGACQPKILSYNNPQEFEHAGASGGFMDKFGFPFCRGRIFAHFEKDAEQYDSNAQVFWATGTCLAIKRKAWQACGGFDADLFAHMEEIDLCWRIQRLGYQVHAIPRSVVKHVGGGTLPYKHPRKTYLNFRNSLIVLVKNAPSPLLPILVKRFSLDAIAAWKFLLEGNASHFIAVAKAHLHFITSLSSTLSKRKELRKAAPAFWPYGTYKRSIAWQHFLRGKKKYSELNERDFKREQSTTV